MKKTSLLLAGTAAAALLLTATPALAFEGGSGEGGLHVGAYVSTFVHDLKVNTNDNASVKADLGSKHHDNDNDWDDATNTATTSPAVKPVKTPKTIEVGTVFGVNGSNITLSPAIAFGATTTASANVVTNSSTKFEGASSSASLTNGENVLIVGTTSTSSPNTITASFVIALQDIGHFFAHLFNR